LAEKAGIRSFKPFYNMYKQSAPELGIAQAMQIEQIASLCDETDATAYVVHNSAKETIPTLKRYQEDGVEVYGETLQGAPTHTIKGGDVVVEDDEIVTEKGIGEYLPRGPDGVERA